MQKSLIIILFLISNLIFGQDKSDPTESFVTKFKSEMMKENISNFFIVKHISPGNTRIIELKDPNSCNENGYYFVMYAFWENGNETWIKKYDNCGEFKNVKLTNSKPIKFYKKNIESLKINDVQPYIFKPDSIANGKKYSFISGRTHTAHRYFWFFQDSTEFEKKFDKYNLETEKNNKNLNYELNNNLSIVKLNIICEEIINEMETMKIFTRLK